MGVKRIKFPSEKTDYVKFDGGLDVMTPPLELPGAYCRAAQNYEIPINGGYQGITGYERFDGQTRPSDCTYSILTATITGTFNVGDMLAGLTSGATGIIAGYTSEYFILTMVNGSFQAGEDLYIL